jgi:hypothetical protein
MKTISIAGAMNDSERMMNSLMNAMVGDAERERNKHPKTKQSITDHDTGTDAAGKESAAQELQALEQMGLGIEGLMAELINTISNIPGAK